MTEDTLSTTTDNFTTMVNEKGAPLLLRPAKRNPSRVLPVAFTAVAVLYLLFSLRNPFIYYYHNSSFGSAQTPSSHPAQSAKGLVPLEAHIMSKCKDTQVGLSEVLDLYVLTL